MAAARVFFERYSPMAARRGWSLPVLIVALICAGGASLWPVEARVARSQDVPATSPDMLPRADIVNAMTGVADHWISTHQIPDAGWDAAVHFWGLSELYAVAGEDRYFDRIHQWGETNHWQPYNTNPACTQSGPPCAPDTDANNTLAGMTYWNQLDFGDASATISNVEPSLAAQRTTAYPWVDLFFMGFPLSARYGQTNSDTSYFDGIWHIFSTDRDVGVAFNNAPARPLYNPAYRLWYRDASFAGSTLFWGRGNGWVIAGLASMLEYLPQDDPHRDDYVGMLRDMSAALAAVQRSDGFLVSSLVPTAGYNSSDQETTSTALYTLALLKLVRLGVLDSATYLPRAVAAWNGMASIAVQPDGTLGYCQSTGDRPTTGRLRPSDTSWTCVGAFLLAGAELASSTGEADAPKPHPRRMWCNEMSAW